MDGAAGRKTRVLVVDDHPIVSFGVAQVINRQLDLECCGQAESLALAKKIFETCRADVVTVDLRLPDGDGLELIKHFIATKPAISILVVSLCDECTYAERVLKAGARGYLVKESAPEEIVTAIRTILKGELYFSAKVAALALNQLAGRKVKTKGSSIDLLTDRELQVLQLLGAGLGTRAIGGKLGLSVKTVETHRENIKHKLRIPDATGLVHYAVNWVENRHQSSHVDGGNS